MKQFCYHITDGVKRSALSCGTIHAENMEQAAKGAAKRDKLVVVVFEDEFSGLIQRRWQTADGKDRNIYVLHDPE